MNIQKTLVFICLLGLLPLWPVASILAGYKARPWDIGPRDTYPASLTSEGVTIAVQALFNDTLAARVFDKSDVITRGIMPLAVIIFNDNDFPVEVDGLSIELIHGEEHIHSLSPNEVVGRLFRKDSTWLPRVSRAPRSELNTAALNDFDSKFLMEKVVAPHDKGGGFLYVHIPEKDMLTYLSNSVVYIPNVYRRDKDTRMIFFEIGLGPAISTPSRD